MDNELHILDTPWYKLDSYRNLLVQFAVVDNDSYAIRLTDLQHVWGENMTCTQVQERAEDLECPFDGDDVDQLLEHLHDCVAGSNQNVKLRVKQEYAIVRLHLASTVGSSHVAVNWFFKMTSLSYTAIASGLSTALFGMLAFYQQQIASLLGTIKSKDGVIHSMDQFCQDNKLEYRPNRRKHAFERFEPDDFANDMRRAIVDKHQSAADVLEHIHEVGHDATFAKDWKAVLSNVQKWEVQVLHQDAENPSTASKPATVASSDDFVESMPPPQSPADSATTDGEMLNADGDGDHSPESSTSHTADARSNNPRTRIDDRTAGHRNGSPSPKTPVKSRIGGPSQLPSPVKSRIGGDLIDEGDSGKQTPPQHTPVKSRIGGAAPTPSPSVKSRTGGHDDRAPPPKAQDWPMHGGKASSRIESKPSEKATEEDEHEARRKRLAESMALAQAPAKKKKRQF